MSHPTPPDSSPSFSGSELRDRMANERTLLAWVRTAIALMAFGMAICFVSAFVHDKSTPFHSYSDYAVSMAATCLVLSLPSSSEHQTSCACRAGEILVAPIAQVDKLVRGQRK